MKKRKIGIKETKEAKKRLLKYCTDMQRSENKIKKKNIFLIYWSKKARTYTQYHFVYIWT